MEKKLDFLVKPCLFSMASSSPIEGELITRYSQVLVFSHSQPEKVERSIIFFVLSYGLIWKFFHCTSIFFSFFP